MAYGTLTGVRGWLPKGQALDDSTQNPPSAAAVTIWLAQLSSLLDVVFGATTDPDQVAVRKFMSEREATYQVMAVRASSKSEKAEPLYLTWHEEWLALFPEGAISASWTAGSDLPDSFTRDANPEDSADSRNPVFTKDYVP